MSSARSSPGNDPQQQNRFSRNHPAETAHRSSSRSDSRMIMIKDSLPLYDVDFTFTVSVPRDRIATATLPPSAQKPSSRRHSKRQQSAVLILCPHGVDCRAPATCSYAHADIEGLARHTVHVNYAWQSEDVVSYPRLPPGNTICALAPNHRPPLDVIPSQRVLVTQGSLNHHHQQQQPLEQCAHYYFNHVCNRGETCSFIHAVHIDPNAAPRQRAPVQIVKRFAHGGETDDDTKTITRNRSPPPALLSTINTPTTTNNNTRTSNIDSGMLSLSMSRNSASFSTLPPEGGRMDHGLVFDGERWSASACVDAPQAIDTATTITSPDVSSAYPRQLLFYDSASSMKLEGSKKVLINGAGTAIAYHNWPYRN